MGLKTSKEEKVFDVPLFVVEIKVPLHHAIVVMTKYYYAYTSSKESVGGPLGTLKTRSSNQKIKTKVLKLVRPSVR